MTVSRGVRAADRTLPSLRPFGHWMIWLVAAVAIQIVVTLPTRAQQEPADGLAEVQVENPPSVLAQFTTGIEDREPVDQITFVENGVKKIFFFSDLRGLAGRTVQHRWIYDGKTIAEVNFEVRGPRWRVWSSKELLADWIGDWTVEIVTVDADDDTDDGLGDGEVIAAETFTYSAPDA
jgi:hypothetical protein